MHRGLFFASIATYMVGCVGWAIATPLSEVSDRLPSSFAPSGYAKDRQHLYLGPTPIPGKFAQTDDNEIFSISKLVPGSFNDIVPSEFSHLSPDRPIPSIEELIIVASLTPASLGAPRQFDGPSIQGPNNSAAPGTRVGDLMKALVNRPVQQASDRSPRQNNDEAGSGFYLLTSLLETQLDREFVDAAAGVVNPSIDLGGTVTLNIFGLREIAFLTSPVTDELQVMDFRSKMSISVSHGTSPAPLPQQILNSPDRVQQTRFRNAGDSFSAVKFFKAAKSFVTDILLHPVTLGITLILLIIFSFRRMAQEA